MAENPLDRYEVVIGLEVHTHLKTHSKLFSPAPFRYLDAQIISLIKISEPTTQALMSIAGLYF